MAKKHNLQLQTAPDRPGMIDPRRVLALWQEPTAPVRPGKWPRTNVPSPHSLGHVGSHSQGSPGIQLPLTWHPSAIKAIFLPLRQFAGAWRPPGALNRIWSLRMSCRFFKSNFFAFMHFFHSGTVRLKKSRERGRSHRLMFLLVKHHLTVSVWTLKCRPIEYAN